MISNNTGISSSFLVAQNTAVTVFITDIDRALGPRRDNMPLVTTTEMFKKPTKVATLSALST